MYAVKNFNPDVLAPGATLGTQLPWRQIRAVPAGAGRPFPHVTLIRYRAVMAITFGAEAGTAVVLPLAFFSLLNFAFPGLNPTFNASVMSLVKATRGDNNGEYPGLAYSSFVSGGGAAGTVAIDNTLYTGKALTLTGNDNLYLSVEFVLPWIRPISTRPLDFVQSADLFVEPVQSIKCGQLSDMLIAGSDGVTIAAMTGTLSYNVEIRFLRRKRQAVNLVWLQDQILAGQTKPPLLQYAQAQMLGSWLSPYLDSAQFLSSDFNSLGQTIGTETITEQDQDVTEYLSQFDYLNSETPYLPHTEFHALDSTHVNDLSYSVPLWFSEKRGEGFTLAKSSRYALNPYQIYAGNGQVNQNYQVMRLVAYLHSQCAKTIAANAGGGIGYQHLANGSKQGTAVGPVKSVAPYVLTKPNRVAGKV